MTVDDGERSTSSNSSDPGGSRGVAVTNWFVNKAAGFLEKRTSRRGFLVGSAMVGSAVAVAGCTFAVEPGTPYNHITDCAPGSLCTDGYTEFCCAINRGLNTCPPGSFPGGWWRADFSSFCNGTRYYIDCMQNCCGQAINNQFCAGCSECRCAGDCNHRRVYCNYFRYGQCHQEITQSGPIACRVVSCVAPWTNDPSCTTAGAVDNATAEHVGNCPPPPPPTAGLLPASGSVVAKGGHVTVFARLIDATVGYRDFDGTAWSPWQNLIGRATSNVKAVDDLSGRYVFIRADDNALWYRKYDGTNWSDWISTGSGPVAGDPVVVADFEGLHLFVRGTGGDLRYRRAQGGNWGSWTSLDGALGSDPCAVTTWGQGLFVFIRSTEGWLWVKRRVGGQWSGWQWLYGIITGDITAAADAGNGVQVFIRADDNALWTRRFANGAWSDWSRLDGALTGDPIAYNATTGVYAFIRADDYALWYRRWGGAGWEPWTSIQGLLTANPAIVSDAAGLVYAFIRANDGAIWYRLLSFAGWSNWVSLGGATAPVRAFP